jgi:hypothetical protein
VDRDGNIDGFIGAGVGVDAVRAALRGQRRLRWRWKIGAQPPALAGRTFLHRACLGRSTSGMINAVDSIFPENLFACSTRA